MHQFRRGPDQSRFGPATVVDAYGARRAFECQLLMRGIGKVIAEDVDGRHRAGRREEHAKTLRALDRVGTSLRSSGLEVEGNQLPVFGTVGRDDLSKVSGVLLYEPDEGRCRRAAESFRFDRRAKVSEPGGDVGHPALGVEAAAVELTIGAAISGESPLAVIL